MPSLGFLFEEFVNPLSSLGKEAGFDQSRFDAWLASDLEANQAEMKFRRLRLYLGTKTDFIIPDKEIRLEISKLQHLLSLPEPIETPVRKTQTKRKPTPKS